MIPSALPRLQGRWLFIARLSWIGIVAITAVLLVVALAINAIGWWSWNPSPADCPKEGYEVCIGDIQANQQLGLTNRFWAVYYTLGASLEMVPYILVGVLIFWRKSDYLFELLFSLMLVLVGALLIDPIADSIFFHYHPKYHAIFPLLGSIGSTLLILWYRFPDGRLVAQVFRWPALIWSLLNLLEYFFPNTVLSLNTWPALIQDFIRNGFILTIIISLVYRYRFVSTAIQRQQIKWVVTFGVFFMFIYIAADYVYSKFRTPGLPTAITNLTFLPVFYLSSGLLAASFAMAILRYRLWDIDVIIRKTLIYGALTGTLSLVFLVLVVGLQIIFSPQSQAALMLSTLAVAGLFTPLRRRIQRDIDQRFFRNKYNAEMILAAFTSSLREQVDPDQITEQMVRMAKETMQPESISLWQRSATTEKRSGWIHQGMQE
jgi:hypothetical protein